MSGGVVSLRQARKQRARARKRADGDASAALHGRSKPERDLQRARAQKARDDLDGHRRE